MKPSKFDLDDYVSIIMSDSDDDDNINFGLNVFVPNTNTSRKYFKASMQCDTRCNHNAANEGMDTSYDDFNVDAAMNKAYKTNEKQIINESIRPIADNIYANYNSLNIIVGAQGKGKSHIVLRDVIQMSRMKNKNFHLIVYISKNASINDQTYLVQKDLIQLPVKVISDNDAEKYLRELDLWKELYDKYCEVSMSRTANMSRKAIIDETKLQQMFEFLHINKLGLSNEPLNTIIICEDFIKSKLLKSSYFTNYISQLRHKHSIVYINIQFFKAIPTDYKNNCTSFFIFNGFSRQKLNYIYHQISMPIEFEELWHKYIYMKNHDFVLVNTKTSCIEFVMQKNI